MLHLHFSFYLQVREISENFPCFYCEKGWVINLGSIPVVFGWVKDISYLKYGYEALALNEFEGAKFYCTSEELAQTNGFCPITTGEQVIDNLSMKSASIGRSFGVIIAIIVILRSLFWVFIKFKNQMPNK